jgi:hypothetical protein
MFSVLFLKICIHYTRIIMNIVKMVVIKIQVPHTSNVLNTNNTFLYMHNIYSYIEMDHSNIA